MKILLTLLLVCVTIGTCLTAQSLSRSVMAAQGNVSTTTNLSLEWTLGETYVETGFAGNVLLTQGFHQYSIPVDKIYPTGSPLNPGNNIPGKWGDAKNFLALSAFPNPFKRNITIDLGPHTDQLFRLHIVDPSGILVHSTIIPEGQDQTTIRNLELAPALYTITVQGLKDGKFGSLQLIKSE